MLNLVLEVNSYMKKFLTYFLIPCLILLAACSPDGESDTSDDLRSECGTHNGNLLDIGPEGGCYYINSSGNKTYVDRSECQC